MEIINIQRHLAQQEKLYREARGDFSALLLQIALAAKMVAAQVRRAGLLNVLGNAGAENVQGEEQQKLDVLANEIMKKVFLGIGYVGGVASEEEEGIVEIPEGLVEGKYILVFDPLDGSSNIDANVSIGTIFSICRVLGPGINGAEEHDFLQPGRQQVAAGYVLYGSSTMLVYTAGNGVNGFTLDPSIGEFVLSHEDIRIPDRCQVYSANSSNYPSWPEGARAFADHVFSRKEARYANTKSRYVGSLVADFHRNLLYGGIFLYPEDGKNPDGKLRLLYECNPLAFVAEQAGGAASSGKKRILDIQPKGLHQRVPFITGGKQDVALYETFYKGKR